MMVAIDGGTRSILVLFGYNRIVVVVVVVRNGREYEGPPKERQPRS